MKRFENSIKDEVNLARQEASRHLEYLFELSDWQGICNKTGSIHNIFTEFENSYLDLDLSVEKMDILTIGAFACLWINELNKAREYLDLFDKLAQQSQCTDYTARLFEVIKENNWLFYISGKNKKNLRHKKINEIRKRLITGQSLSDSVTIIECRKLMRLCHQSYLEKDNLDIEFFPKTMKALITKVAKYPHHKIEQLFYLQSLIVDHYMVISKNQIEPWTRKKYAQLALDSYLKSIQLIFADAYFTRPPQNEQEMQDVINIILNCINVFNNTPSMNENGIHKMQKICLIFVIQCIDISARIGWYTEAGRMGKTLSSMLTMNIPRLDKINEDIQLYLIDDLKEDQLLTADFENMEIFTNEEKQNKPSKKSKKNKKKKNNSKQQINHKKSEKKINNNISEPCDLIPDGIIEEIPDTLIGMMQKIESETGCKVFIVGSYSLSFFGLKQEKSDIDLVIFGVQTAELRNQFYDVFPKLFTSPLYSPPYRDIYQKLYQLDDPQLGRIDFYLSTVEGDIKNNLKAYVDRDACTRIATINAIYIDSDKNYFAPNGGKKDFEARMLTPADNVANMISNLIEDPMRALIVLYKCIITQSELHSDFELILKSTPFQAPIDIETANRLSIITTNIFTKKLKKTSLRKTMIQFMRDYDLGRIYTGASDQPLPDWIENFAYFSPEQYAPSYFFSNKSLEKTIPFDDEKKGPVNTVNRLC